MGVDVGVEMEGRERAEGREKEEGKRGKMMGF